MKNGWCQNEFGDLEHYVSNKWHNEKVSAFICDNGIKFWYQNDKFHRLDGPALERSNGDKVWFYQGKEIECKSQQEFERYLKLKLLW